MSLPTWEVDCESGEETEGSVTEEELWPNGIPEFDPITLDADRLALIKQLISEHPILKVNINQMEAWVDNNIDVDAIENLAEAKVVMNAMKETLKETAAGIILIRKFLIMLATDNESPPQT